MTEERYAIVIDNCTQMLFYLVSYAIESSGYDIKEYYDIPARVMETEFCDNILSRPMDITDDNEIEINSMRGFYGWHVGNKDFERIRKLIETLKEVEVFERLSKYPEAN